MLAKPAWNPPGWIFGPVWTALYALMGMAVWLVWRRGGWRAQSLPLALFLVQLALNAAWTPLFFALHSPALAFADIVMRWLAIGVTIALFRRVSVPAAWALAPCFAWVGISAFLNFTIWQLNRCAGGLPFCTM